MRHLQSGIGGLEILQHASRVVLGEVGTEVEVVRNESAPARGIFALYASPARRARSANDAWARLHSGSCLRPESHRDREAAVNRGREYSPRGILLSRLEERRSAHLWI